MGKGSTLAYVVGAGLLLAFPATVHAQAPGPLATDALKAARDPDFDALRTQVERLRSLERKQADQLDRALEDLQFQEEVKEALDIAQQINQLQLEIDVETAKAKVRASEAVVAQAQARLRELERRRDLSKPDAEIDAARSDLAVAERLLSLDRYGVELAESKLANRQGPSQDYLENFYAAHRRFNALGGELDATQVELADLIAQLVGLSQAYPPTYLVRVEASVAGEPIYLAEWREQPGRGELSESDRRLLEEAEARLVRENVLIADGLDEERREREKLLAELEIITPKIEAQARQAYYTRIVSTVLVASIEAGASAYAIGQTGGLAALPGLFETLEPLIQRRAADAVRIVEKGAGPVVGKVSAAAIVSAFSQGAPATAPPPGFDPREPFTPNRNMAAGKTAAKQVLVGDVLESLSGPVPFAALSGFAGGGREVFPAYKSGLTSGLKLTIGASLGKAVVAGIGEYLASESERRFAQLVVDAGVISMGLYNSRERMRPADERFQENARQIARIRSTLASGQRQVQLTKLLDKPIPERNVSRGIDLRLTFSTTLSVPPKITLATSEGRKAVATGVVTSGRDRKVWSAKVPGTSAQALRGFAAIEVALDPTNLPYARLDSRPATSPEFDLPKLTWNKVETGADRNHFLQFYKVQPDLTGIWGYSGEFFIEQNADQVTIRHRRRSDERLIEAGSLHFSGTLVGEALRGTYYNYPPRKSSGRNCAQVLNEDVVWKVDTDPITLQPDTIRSTVTNGIWVGECKWKSYGEFHFPLIYREQGNAPRGN